MSYYILLTPTRDGTRYGLEFREQLKVTTFSAVIQIHGKGAPWISTHVSRIRHGVPRASNPCVPQLHYRSTLHSSTLETGSTYGM